MRMIGASASSPSVSCAAFGDLQIRDRVFADFFLQNVGRFIRGAVVFDERLANFFRAGADQFDLALQEKAQAIDRVDVERIADRDDQAAVAEADRDDLEAARVFAADLFDHSGGMVMVERSIQSMCACAARLRETSASETRPSLIKTSTTLARR